MGGSGFSPAPDLPEHELPDAFADFFDNKIRQLRENIDTASDGSDTDPFDHDNAFCGQSLAEFEPVSEMEMRETILKCSPKSSEADPIPSMRLFLSWQSFLMHRWVVALCLLLSREQKFYRCWRKRASTQTCSKTTDRSRICRFSRKYLRKSCLLVWADILSAMASWNLCNRVNDQTILRKLRCWN